MAAKSLKDGNRISLYLVMLANLAFYYMVVQHNAIAAGSWPDLVRHVSTLLPAGFGLILTGILNAQFSAEMKSRIVFMRWGHALPGCEAFSTHAKHDARIDLAS